jgi:uncharacterized phiE125 gp8 family phage protein
MLKLITAATEEPVSAEEFYAHVRIDGIDDAGDVAIKLLAAREYIEQVELRNRALITSTWSVSMENWPDGQGYIEVPLGNLQSVTSVTYRLSDGTTSTWAATEYRVERLYASGTTDCGIGRIYRRYGKYWPTDLLDTGEPIIITFVCGWATASVVPYSLKAAIQLVAGTLYRNRESVNVGDSTVIMAALQISGTGGAVESLCSRYTDRRF